MDSENSEAKNSGSAPGGLIHVYYGDGKGKTTAAVGLAVRAAGCGKKVLVAQFFKGRPSGEVALLDALAEITVLRDDSSDKFMWEMNEEESAAYAASQAALLSEAWNLAVAGSYDLLVLDEVLYLPFYEIVSEQQLLDMLRSKPSQLEVVLTGHESGAALQQAADYVTQMVKLKHPYDAGIKQRRGIEF